MRAGYPVPGAPHPLLKKDVHLLSAVAAVLAFIIVYAYADDERLYYAIAAATLMGGAIYFASHRQLRQGRKR